MGKEPLQELMDFDVEEVLSEIKEQAQNRIEIKEMSEETAGTDTVEKPVQTEDTSANTPGYTEQADLTEEPAMEEADAVEEPAPVEKKVAVAKKTAPMKKKAVVAEEPTIAERPAPAEKKAEVAEEPTTAEKPAPAEKKAEVAEEPTIAEKPAPAEKKAEVAEEPSAAEEPAPVKKKADKVEEPTTAEEPNTMEEPAPVEKKADKAKESEKNVHIEKEAPGKDAGAFQEKAHKLVFSDLSKGTDDAASEEEEQKKKIQFSYFPSDRPASEKPTSAPKKTSLKIEIVPLRPEKAEESADGPFTDTLAPYVEEDPSVSDSFSEEEPEKNDRKEPNGLLTFFFPMKGDSAGKLAQKGLIWVCAAVIIACLAWLLVAGPNGRKMVANVQTIQPSAFALFAQQAEASLIQNRSEGGIELVR